MESKSVCNNTGDDKIGLLRCTLFSKLLGFSASITTFANSSALNRGFVRVSNFVIVLINW